MPKVHYVKKSRTDNPIVKRGESYYWWKFPYTDKVFSKTYPKRSQLTLSDYMGCVFDLQDSVTDYSDISTPDEFSDMIMDLTEQITDMRDQCKESLENMKENLHVAPNGKLLSNRIVSCDTVIGELASLDWDEEEFENADEKFDTAEIDAALGNLEVER